MVQKKRKTSKKNNAPYLSVVIPAYNERARLPPFLEELVAYFQKIRTKDYEIIIVDDGSTDRTFASDAVVEVSDRTCKVLTHAKNLGKGAAVRTGMLAAKGKYRLFVDADGSSSASQITTLLEVMIAKRADIVIGSRIPLDSTEEPQRDGHRFWLSSIFTFFVRRITGLPFRDTQCGIKLFTATAAESIFSQTKLDGFAFDVEVLSLAKKMDLRVKEAWVEWQQMPGSKVNILSDSVKMLSDLQKIRQLHPEKTATRKRKKAA
jgi:dolichyl-phosphate beta-glucosyltransferase